MLQISLNELLASTMTIRKISEFAAIKGIR